MKNNKRVKKHINFLRKGLFNLQCVHTNFIERLTRAEPFDPVLGGVLGRYSGQRIIGQPRRPFQPMQPQQTAKRQDVICGSINDKN